MAVVVGRLRFIDRIGDELASSFAAITRTGMAIRARYESKLLDLSAEQVVAQHRANRVRDLAAQSTLLGPHRDDLVFELDGKEAGSFASQGQLRAIMLAWKTAELVVLGQMHDDLPILLLDDVSSELDQTRNEFLFEHLAKLAGQCFITTTHASHVLLASNRADYRIQSGRILE